MASERLFVLHNYFHTALMALDGSVDPSELNFSLAYQRLFGMTKHSFLSLV